MGTSSSSSGPGAGVPFDPPWLDSVSTEFENPLDQISGEAEDSTQNPQKIAPVPQNFELAPSRRFGNARRHLGEFVKSGHKGSLKKALGSYSRIGMGGATKVASRMRTSTSVGANIFNFLQEVRDSPNAKVREWVNQLTARNLSAYEVIDEIIGLMIPVGGSLEEESCRDSMAQAMSDLLIADPEIDFTSMSNDSIWTVMELFIANEAFNRLNLDIGQLFESGRYSPRESVNRMNEMREYLKSEISAQIRELRTNETNPPIDEIKGILQTAILVTFEVFEEEI